MVASRTNILARFALTLSYVRNIAACCGITDKASRVEVRRDVSEMQKTIFLASFFRAKCNLIRVSRKEIVGVLPDPDSDRTQRAICGRFLHKPTFKMEFRRFTFVNARVVQWG